MLQPQSSRCGAQSNAEQKFEHAEHCGATVCQVEDNTKAVTAGPVTMVVGESLDR